MIDKFEDYAVDNSERFLGAIRSLGGVVRFDYEEGFRLDTRKAFQSRCPSNGVNVSDSGELNRCLGVLAAYGEIVSQTDNEGLTYRLR